MLSVDRGRQIPGELIELGGHAPEIGITNLFDGCQRASAERRRDFHGGRTAAREQQAHAPVAGEIDVETLSDVAFHQCSACRADHERALAIDEGVQIYLR